MLYEVYLTVKPFFLLFNFEHRLPIRNNNSVNIGLATHVYKTILY